MLKILIQPRHHGLRGHLVLRCLFVPAQPLPPSRVAARAQPLAHAAKQGGCALGDVPGSAGLVHPPPQCCQVLQPTRKSPLDVARGEFPTAVAKLHASREGGHLVHGERFRPVERQTRRSCPGLGQVRLRGTPQGGSPLVLLIEVGGFDNLHDLAELGPGADRVRIHRRCHSSRRMTWSRHSGRMLPITPLGKRILPGTARGDENFFFDHSERYLQRLRQRSHPFAVISARRLHCPRCDPVPYLPRRTAQLLSP